MNVSESCYKVLSTTLEPYPTDVHELQRDKITQKTDISSRNLVMLVVLM